MSTEYRRLGASGLQVSPLALGTMTFGNPVPESEAVALTRDAVEAGINLIDTADMYEGYDRYLGSPGGVAETILGKALRGRRDKVVVVTKGGAPVGPGPLDRGLGAVHLMRQIESSLRRLETDYIDVYLAHWPDRETPLEITVGVLDRAVRQGKIRYFGASNHVAAELCEMLWLADRRGLERPVVSQVPVSLLRREYEGDLAFCERHRFGVMAYQPLQGGLLTGRYQRGAEAPEGSRGRDKPEWLGRIDDGTWRGLERLRDLAARAETTPAGIALAWVVSRPGITSAVVGVRSRRQLDGLLARPDVDLIGRLEGELDAVFSPPWHRPDPVRGR